MNRWGKIAAWAAVAATAATMGVVAVREYRAGAASSAACEVLEQQSRDRGTPDTIAGNGITIGIVGDSYSSGDGLANYTDAWSYRLQRDTGTEALISGIGYTGFVNPGPCGNQAFATRVDQVQTADLIIIEGGLNDDNETAEKVTAAAAGLIRAFPDKPVYVLGPVDVPARANEATIDQALAAAARDTGATYVSTLTWPVEVGPDDTHLTAAGHADFASRAAAAIRELSEP